MWSHLWVERGDLLRGNVTNFQMWLTSKICDVQVCTGSSCVARTTSKTKNLQCVVMLQSSRFNSRLWSLKVHLIFIFSFHLASWAVLYWKHFLKNLTWLWLKGKVCKLTSVKQRAMPQPVHSISWKLFEETGSGEQTKEDHSAEYTFN